tara:strand:- start:609 stop:1199 length:591 start_codon:yes stop_codon:yes gene_type:complete
MPSVIIRPSGTIGSLAGFDVSESVFISRIGDNNTSTVATQNNITCSAVGIPFEDKSAYDSATINSITLSVTGAAGGRGSGPEITCVIKNGNSTLQTSELTFNSATTLSGDAYSTNLTPTIVNNLTLNITPDSTGVALKEVYITVDYTAGGGGGGEGGGGGGAAAGYTHKVSGVAAASIAKVNTVATANIGKINTVD